MGDWLEERLQLQPLLVLSSLAAVVVGVDSHRHRRRHVWVKVVSSGGGHNRLPSGVCSMSSTIVVYLE